MNTTAKLTIKDVITTVLLSALLVVIQFIVNIVCMANHFVSMTLSVGFSVFICAPVYFLMVQRVGKRGVSFIYMRWFPACYLTEQICFQSGFSGMLIMPLPFQAE